MCANFDAPAASTLETEAVFSNVPTLLLNGGMDMQTSFAWGEQTAKNLTNSTTVLIPLSDHITVYQSECAQSIATQFMDDPNSILDTSCATDLLKPVITTSSDLEAEFTP